MSISHRMCCLVCLCTGVLFSAEPDSGHQTVEQMQALAAKADAGRERLSQLRDDWAREKARLELLLQTQQDHLSRLDQAIQQSEQDISAIDQEIGARREQLDEVDAILTKADSLAERIHKLVTAQRQHSPLHIHGQALQAGIAASPLKKAFTLLNDAERASRQITVRTVTGSMPDGSMRGVEVLCLGGAQAWWRSPDSLTAGTVTVTDGTITLTPTSDPAMTQAILQAFFIRHAKEDAALVSLPLPGAQRD